MARRRSSYSSHFKNPYGRTYRRPRKFKTLAKHVLQDSIDSAVYNAFDNPQRKLQKEIKEQKRLKNKEDSAFLSKLDNKNMNLIAPQILFNQSDYLQKAETFYTEYSTLLKSKIDLQNDLLDTQNRLSNLDKEGILNHRLSGNPIWLVVLVLSIVIIIANFSLITIVVGVVLVLAASFILNPGIKKKLTGHIQSHESRIDRLSGLLDDYNLKMSFQMEDQVRESYDNLTSSFQKASSCSRIWDILSYSANENNPTNYKRKKVIFIPEAPTDIDVEIPFLHLSNIDGDDLYLTPLFILAFDQNEISFLDYRDVIISDSKIEMLESEIPRPSDIEVLDLKWEFSNKDGSPNRRYSNNRELPLVNYTRVDLNTEDGHLNETYLFSNSSKVIPFLEAIRTHKMLFD